MKWSELPTHLKIDIARSLLDVESLDAVSEEQVKRLDTLPPEELFRSWCAWQGFLGWAGAIREAWDTIRGDVKLPTEETK